MLNNQKAIENIFHKIKVSLSLQVEDALVLLVVAVLRVVNVLQKPLVLFSEIHDEPVHPLDHEFFGELRSVLEEFLNVFRELYFALWYLTIDVVPKLLVFGNVLLVNGAAVLNVLYWRLHRRNEELDQVPVGSEPARVFERLVWEGEERLIQIFFMLSVPEGTPVDEGNVFI